MKSHFDEKLKNWGDWMRKRDDGGSGWGNSVLAGMVAKTTRSEYTSVIPVNEIDAGKTDAAVNSLLPELRKVARLWYVQNLSIRQMAREIGCSTTTVPVRVEQVRHGVAIWFREQEEARQRFIAHREKIISFINTVGG